MTRRLLSALSTIVLLSSVVLVAQRPANSPATLPSGRPPDTVLIEELTWAEVRDLIKAGTTRVIIGTAGTEQKGPHMADGEHKFVMEYAADKIARAVGRTLVAPIITYVPEGNWDPPSGHMTKPGTITLPEDRFVDLLVSAGRSLRSSGFTTIFFLGDSGGNRGGLRTAAEKLNELFRGSARAFWIDDYYTKAHADENQYVTEKLGVPPDQIGGHANILDTSELLFVAPKHVRRNRLTGNDYPNNGVSGDPSRATPELGRIFLDIKVNNAVAEIRRVMVDGTPALPAPAGRGAGRGGRGGAPPSAQAMPAGATMDAAPAGRTPTAPPDTVFIDELTWEETRDLMKAGKTTVIVPTGGTEKNGYHMVVGKHNYIVTYAGNQMARKLKNALVAPTIQYVPEGDPDRQNAGAISLPSPAYDLLLDAAARSLQAHGFKEILFIGDSGGNQAGLRNVAARLNEEWNGRNVRVYALTDYYEKGREHYRAWLEAAYGYDDTIVGSHAGVSDTSQLLFVRPAGIRKDQIKPWGGANDSGVSGDPARATAEIGRMGIEFKVNAALSQFRALKEPRPPGRGSGQSR